MTTWRESLTSTWAEAQMRVHAPTRKCVVFRSRALAGWALCIPFGNRQIQWAQLPSVPPATPLREPINRETGCGHHRQCPLSPLPTAPTVAGTTRPSLCLGVPARLRSRNSTPSSECGRSPAVVDLHNRYFDHLQDVIRRLSPSSQPGPLATMSSADYAQLLKTLCLDPSSDRKEECGSRLTGPQSDRSKNSRSTAKTR